MVPNASTKYDLEKFDGSNNFSLWRMKMHAVSKGFTISSSDGEWILDTGCSYHMYPNRDWFATYHSFDGGKVLMGNDVTCKVVGICSIQIRMHDGIVRTLTDVRHVLELRKNLISLGMLNSNGCSYRVTCGVMRIIKGALVVMKGLKQNSLYLLQGSTITEVAAGATSSFDVDSDTTKLWHMRVGHVSERGYTKSAYDSCVYHQSLADGSHIYLLLFHFIRDVVSQGTIMVEKISTDENLADMMTKKHILEIKFKHYLDLINISNI
ncbi:hypothetical protein RJ639_025033 [Escallonia herrerae]|uniref:GAG-pre-integrase domain-containing protein n=1 Tax=Escallonia herrerae TaxID=1293975 RepID=A0AA89ABG4_9ASTE|nr:hypothetical protein RJ639_025033 [Escallonia herrerae]